jgi:hypothetical protein
MAWSQTLGVMLARSLVTLRTGQSIHLDGVANYKFFESDKVFGVE